MRQDYNKNEIWLNRKKKLKRENDRMDMWEKQSTKMRGAKNNEKVGITRCEREQNDERGKGQEHK